MRLNRFLVYAFAGLAVVVMVLLPGEPKSAEAQACTRKARAVRTTPLYAQAPRFITGRGLVYGSQVATLPQGVLVYICDQTTVGFGFSSRIWYRAGYWVNKAWGYAWVLADDVKMEGALQFLNPRWGVFIASAAAGSPPALTAQPAAPPGAASATAPPPGATPPDELPGAAPKRDESALVELYVYGFVLLVAGMVAKTLFDFLEKPEPVRLRRLARQAIIPLLVSPMVFLGFMQSASLTVENRAGFVVLLLLAFQSGFFWHTVINPKIQEAGRRRSRMSGAR